jgi:hypothetical protein
MSVIDRILERGVAPPVHCIDVNVLAKQELNHVQLPLGRRNM